MIDVVGLRHVGIIVSDIYKSRDFYRDFFDFSEIQDFWDDSAYINKITGTVDARVHMIKLRSKTGFVLELLDYETHPTSRLRVPIYNIGLCHLALQVADVDEAFERLSKAGVRFLSEPTESSEGIAKVCFCLDPDDTRLELVEIH